MTQSPSAELAINGGPVESLGPRQPKLGIEELIALIDLCNLKPATREKALSALNDVE